MREAGDGARLLLEPPQPVGIVSESAPSTLIATKKKKIK